MPSYVYECPQCGRFEIFQRISDSALTECPTCAASVKKLIVASPVLIKGAGALKGDGGDWDGKKQVEDYYLRQERKSQQES